MFSFCLVHCSGGEMKPSMYICVLLSWEHDMCTTSELFFSRSLQSGILPTLEVLNFILLIFKRIFMVGQCELVIGSKKIGFFLLSPDHNFHFYRLFLAVIYFCKSSNGNFKVMCTLTRKVKTRLELGRRHCCCSLPFQNFSRQ